MKKKFTETDTEIYYNTIENQYQIPWNSDGSKHWGYFEDLDADDEEATLFRACDHWNEYMLSQSRIDGNSHVLDVGCGNGNTAIYLARETHGEVVGIDISEIHICNAQANAQSFPFLNLSFHKESATNLPFLDNSFSHVWSQGTLLHIHDRDVALREIYRVLQKGGLLLFDDLVALVPTRQMSEFTLKHVYERLHITDLFSWRNYSDCLEEIGFSILEQQNLSLHLKKTYEIQAKRVREQYPERSLSYEKTRDAVIAGEIGWWFYCCQAK